MNAAQGMQLRSEAQDLPGSEINTAVEERNIAGNS